MYKAVARALIRRSVRRLNAGDYGPALAMFAPDATLNFPGANSWARQFHAGDSVHQEMPTHRDRAEIEGFLRRYVAQGIQMEIDDILVNGPPWNTRAAARVRDWIRDADGNEIYANRAVLFVRVRWGRIREQEDYEDTERVAALDARIGSRS